jgi:hypothetical protein
MSDTCSIDYIATKIIEILSKSDNCDKRFSLHGLHSLLISTYSEFSDFIHNSSNNGEKFKSAYINVFMLIEHEYNNIYRFVIADVQYLIWSTKSKNELYYNLDLLNSHYDEQYGSYNFGPVDYCSIVQNYIKSKEFSFMCDNIILDGVNNGLHILIMNKQLKSIKDLVDLTSIDWTITNKDGKSYLDLAKETRDCDIVEFVVESIYTSKNNKLVVHNETLKEKQKELYNKVNDLEREIIIVNVEYHKKVGSLSTGNINKTILILFVSIGWFSTLFFTSNEV